MLRPEIDEDTLWRMRPWLLHWFCVADRLFAYFDIFADTPDVDWFARPKPPTRRPAPAPSSSSSSSAPVNSADLLNDACQSASPTSSGCEIVVHHRPPRRRVDEDLDASHGPSRRPRGSQVSIINAWLASQPHLPELEDAAIFDPTPSGCVSPETRRSGRDSHVLPKASSRSAGEHPTSSRLNPRAPALEPLSKQPPEPCPSEKDPARESDPDNDAADEDGGSEMNSSTCSCSSSSMDGSISTCTDCDELPDLARCRA